jgi:hypothetical protein
VPSLSPDEIRWFEERREFHEAHYLAGTNPRARSGFGRDERDFSEKLAGLARERLPHWRERIFTGNALVWEPPARFDFVRTELVYVHGFVITRVVSLVA